MMSKALERVRIALKEPIGLKATIKFLNEVKTKLSLFERPFKMK